MTDTTAGEGYSLKGEALEMITALEAEATHQGRGKPTDQPGFHKTLWSAAQRLRVADEAEWWNTVGAAILAAQPSAGAQGGAEASWAVTESYNVYASVRDKPYIYEVQPLYPTPAQPDTGDVAALRHRVASEIKTWADVQWPKSCRVGSKGWVDGLTNRILAALSKPNAQGVVDAARWAGKSYAEEIITIDVATTPEDGGA